MKNRPVDNEIDFKNIALKIVDQGENSDDDHYLEEFHQYFSIDLIDELFSLSEDLYFDNPKRSLNISEICCQVADHIDDPLGIALSRWARAIPLNLLGFIGKSLEDFDYSENYLREEGTEVDFIGVQISSIGPLIKSGKYSFAIEKSEKIIKQLESLDVPAPRYWGHVYSNLASAQKALGLYEGAKKSYYCAIEHYDKCNSPFPSANTKISLAILLEDFGEYSQAYKLYLEAKEVFESGDQIHNVAKINMNIGLLFRRVGKYHTALQYLNRSNGIYHEIDNANGYLSTKLFISSVLLDFNLFPEAFEIASEIAGFFRDHQANLDYVHTLINSARALIGLKRFIEAENSLLEARNLLILFRAAYELKYLDFELAQLYIKNGKIFEAIEILDSIIGSTSKTDSIEYRIHYYALISKTECLLNVPTPLHQEAIRLIHDDHFGEISEEDLEILIRISFVKAKINLLENKYRQSKKHIFKAIEGVRKIVGGIGVDELRLNYLSDKEPIVDLAIQLVHEGIDSTQRTYNQLAGILSFFHSAPLISAAETPISREEDNSNLQVLWNRWGWLSNQVDARINSMIDIDTYNAKVSDYSVNELRKIEYQIREESLKYHSTQPSMEIASNIETSLERIGQEVVDNIQSQLTASEAVIQYYWSKNTCHALIIEKKVAWIVNDLVSIKDLENLRRAWNFEMFRVFRSTRDTRESNKLLKKIIQDLYISLIEPLLEKICAKTRLYFVIPPRFHDLPINACWDGNRYLIEKFEINFVTSLGSFQKDRSDLNGIATNSIIVGNSLDGELPWVDVEVNEVGGLLRNYSPTILQNESANISEFSMQIEAATLIHIATHLHYRSDNPKFSSIYLFDGQFSVSELLKIRFSCNPLITISSCDSIRGEPLGGGINSLFRSLFVAGAGKLIGSLWKQEDEVATKIMTGTYENCLINNMRISKALRLAQLKLVEKNHPVYWAGFIYVSS